MCYVYIETRHDEHDNPIQFAVGFFHPNDSWVFESTHDTRESASARVNYLNGGLGHLRDKPTGV